MGKCKTLHKKGTNLDENILNTTLEEEKMRQDRRLNVRVTGLKEGASPNEDAQRPYQSPKLGGSDVTLLGREL